MSTICVEITIIYHRLPHTECVAIDLNDVRTPEEYAKVLAEKAANLLEEVELRYDVLDTGKVEVEIVDLDGIPERYLRPSKANFTRRFWQINRKAA